MNIRLNLGCGKNVLKDFINIDLYEKGDNIVKLDVRQLPYTDNSVSIIGASDILEHIPRKWWKDTLKEWVRVLKPKGQLQLRVPNMLAWAGLVLECRTKRGWDRCMRAIYGGQNYKGNYHYNGFCGWFLKEHLEKLGMKVAWSGIEGMNTVMICEKEEI